MLHTYKIIDQIIVPSNFMADMLRRNDDLREKVYVLRNFVDVSHRNEKKEDYVLYFGRYSHEKGINKLLKICQNLKDIKFVFAGDGPMKGEIEQLGNVTNVGFKSGEELWNLIAKAKFCLFLSECYENCPFSILEAEACGTPVVGCSLGGVPELIEDKIDGEIVNIDNLDEIEDVIKNLWNNEELLELYVNRLKTKKLISLEMYCNRLIELYSE